MKKFCSLVAPILILLLICCNSIGCTNNTAEKSKKEIEDMSIKYETGIYTDFNADETIGNYKGDVIPNEETAIGVSTAIFKNIQKTGIGQTYVLKKVSYDSDNEVWVVSFWEENDGTIIGGDFSIAIKKSTGEILRMWAGE